MKNKTHKAFIGAAIGAVTSIAGGLIAANKQKKIQDAIFRQQQTAQNRADTLQTAQVMSNSYGNQDYIDQYNKKVELRVGGDIKYADRFSNNTVARCGTKRKKANGGTIIPTGPIADPTNTSMDGNSLGLDAGIGGVSSLITNLLTKPNIPKAIVKSDGTSMSANKTNIVVPEYANRFQTMRAGGKRKRKC